MPSINSRKKFEVEGGESLRKEYIKGDLIYEGG